MLKDEPYLRKLGVAGVVGSSLFNNVVLTIVSTVVLNHILPQA